MKIVVQKKTNKTTFTTTNFYTNQDKKENTERE